MKRQIHKTILSWIAVAAMLLSSLGSAAVLAEGDPASVQDAIAAIGQVSFRQSCLDAITAAETAYNNLDETQKNEVSNAALLTAARAEYDRLAAVASELNAFVVFDTSVKEGWSSDESLLNFSIGSSDSSGLHADHHWVLTPTGGEWSVYREANIDLSGREFSDISIGIWVKRVDETDGMVSVDLHNEAGQMVDMAKWFGEIGLSAGQWTFFEMPLSETTDPTVWQTWTEETYQMDSPIVTVEVRNGAKTTAPIEVDGWALYDNSIDTAALVNQANAVVDAIAAIEPVVTAEQEAAVRAARAEYEKLSTLQQQLVVNLAALEDAERQLGELVDPQDVIAAIDAIGMVSYRAACLEKITAAETAFAALSEAQQAEVTNADVLAAARAEYDRLEIVAGDLTILEQFDTTTTDGWSWGECDLAVEVTEFEDHEEHWVVDPIGDWSVWKGLSLDISDYDFDQLKMGIHIVRTSEEDGMVSVRIHNQAGQVMEMYRWFNEIGMAPNQWVFFEMNFNEAKNAKGGDPWPDWTADDWDMDSPIVLIEVRNGAKTPVPVEIDGWALYNEGADVQSLIDAANAVVDQIAAIGTITSAEQEAAVNEARAAYDELSETQQNLVVNADALKAAELALRQYKTASNVTSLITAIGEVSESNYKEKAKPIKDAREAYDNYHEKYEDDSLITNLQTLIDAETAYAGFVAAAKEDEIAALEGLIDAIGEVTAANSKEALPKIEAAEQARDALAETYGEEVLSEVSNLQKLEDARKAYDELNPDVKLGDVNKDTKIDATDALWVLQKTVGLKELSESEAAAADVDRSGEINVTDALYILQMTVELITEFPTAK